MICHNFIGQLSEGGRKAALVKIMFQPYKLIVLSVVLACCVCVASAAAQSNHAQRLPDVKTVDIEASRKIFEGSYSYKMFVKDKSIFDGKMTTELSEVFRPETGGKVSYLLPTVVLERNGIPLSEKSIASQRKNAGKELEKIEKRAAGLAGKSKTITFPDYEWGLSKFAGHQFADDYGNPLDNEEFSDLHKEMLDGRECYVYISIYYDFRYKTKTIEHSLHQIIYVDVADGQFSRLEQYKPGEAKRYIDKSFEEREKGLFSFIRYKRIADGVWAEELYRGPDREITYSDYKIFTTEVISATVNGKTP